MSKFDKITDAMTNVVGPFAKAVSDNNAISALTQGFMYTMPVTLGVAAIAVLVNLPIAPWTAFLQSTGLYNAGTEVVSLTLSLLAIYVVGAIAYSYTHIRKKNEMIGLIMAMGSFLILIPIYNAVDPTTNSTIATIKTSYLGSDGIFVAFIVGILVPMLYCKLMKMNLVLKLPESVPPMVSQSMAPTFVAMIIFTLMFAIKFACTLTPWGDVFTMISTFIGAPITAIGSSPWALMLVYVLMDLVWFFGIHPNAVLMPYMPVLVAVGLANQEAFTNGQALPYLAFAVVGAVAQVGATGNILGLCIATLFAKSEKYKAMRKVVIPANLFNINEPIIFGFPIVLNPIYFLPMILTPVANCLIGYGAYMLFDFAMNPTVSMPWVTPGFATTFVTGGILLMALWIVCMLADFIIYLPFFKMDDKNAYAAEQERAAELEQERAAASQE